MATHRFVPGDTGASVRVPRFSKVLLPGGLQVIAAGPTVDGRQYIVPRWSMLNTATTTLASEGRPQHIKDQIVAQAETHKERATAGVAEWFGACKGETFLVVGSGPSLCRNGHLIERRPGQKIIAINAGLKFLLKIGVKPDFWFVLDWKGDGRWLDDVGDLSGISLITSFTTPPELLDRFENHYHFVGYTKSIGHVEGLNETYAHMGALDAGLTATYSAMHFAYRTGARRIVLVGQDFAFTFGMYHWDEAIPVSVMRDRKLFPVEDIRGDVTFTDDHLLRNMRLIKAAAMWCKEDGVDVVNATEGGVLDWNPKPLATVYEDDGNESIQRNADLQDPVRVGSGAGHCP